MYPKQQQQQSLSMDGAYLAHAEQVRADAERSQRYLSWESAALVPAVQSVITGLFFAPLAGLAANMLGSSQAWQLAGLAGFASTSVLWLSSIYRWHQAVSALDATAPPMPQQLTPANVQNIERVSIEVSDKRSIKILNVNMSTERLANVAHAVLNGTPFAERQLAGGDGLLTQQQFRELRDELFARGLIVWKNPSEPRQGVEFTVAGRAMLRKLAELPQLQRALPDGSV